MEKEKLNQFIHEKVFGECWHKWEREIICLDAKWICLYEDCRDIYGYAEEGDPKPPINPDYTSMFMTVWEKIEGEDWFEDFVEFANGKEKHMTTMPEDSFIPISLINSKRLCELIVERLKEEGE